MRNSALLAWVIPAVCLAADAPGPQVRKYTSPLDGTEQPYAFYLPRRFDPGRRYPLVVALHGEGSNHRLMLRRVFGRPNRAGESDLEASYLMPPLPDVDFLVACPFAREANGYQGFVENDVYAMLDDVLRHFPVDEDRIYLTGQAGGGGGALRLALTRPDRWAAVAIICPMPPPGLEPLAPNTLNLPIRIVHGTLDSLAPVETSREWRQRLLSFGNQVLYEEVNGGKHNVWDLAYRGAGIFEWFSGYRRNRFPERVRMVAENGDGASAYWLEFSGEEVDARFTGDNRLEVSTRNTSEIGFRLDGHPRYQAQQPLTVVLDGETIPLAAPHRLVRQGPSEGMAAGGPLRRIFSGRHIYVYGTRNAGEEELTRRKRRAEQAARWSATVRLPVKADRELTASDEREANLVLFGTAETNLVLARLAPHLPLSLNVSAADYGLVYLYPHNGRFVVVESGVEWKADRLSGVDYVLFRGPEQTVVAQGRFGRGWRVPSAAAEALRATRAVALR